MADDLAKDHHTTVVVRKYKALFSAYDGQVERRKIQDTNILNLIMLYLTYTAKESVHKIPMEIWKSDRFSNCSGDIWLYEQ